jgi:hypothetical protein
LNSLLSDVLKEQAALFMRKQNFESAISTGVSELFCLETPVNIGLFENLFRCTPCPWNGKTKERPKPLSFLLLPLLRHACVSRWASRATRGLCD